MRLVGPILLLIIIVNGLIVSIAQAEPAIPIPKIGLDITEAKNPKDVALTIQILFLLTILSLVPSLLIMLTSFVRVVIVFSFIKRALATQEMPPQQVIIGLALFLTFFIMAPTISTIHSNAVKPYLNGEITVGEGLTKAELPLREFMFKQTRERDIDLFLDISKLPRPKNRDEVPTYVLIPSFMISELTTAFQMGIILFIPFIVIDMVVASVLMSMGMIMLPPIMISMPFKILLFIIVDGWHLITRSVILSFH